MSEAAYEMMVGSEGKKDYLIIATQGQAAIGIKPVIELLATEIPQEYARLIGVRIRLSSAPGATILNAEHIAKTLYGMIPWQKFAADRVSVFLGAIIPPFPKDMTPEILMGKLEDSGFFNQIKECMTPIYEHSQEVPHSTEDVIIFVQKKYRELLKEHLPTLPVASSAGKVVPFKPKENN